MKIDIARFDAEADLLVFGAGAGGMTAALTAAAEGLSVILCEKTSLVGGTTSTSGGTTWVPGTSLSQRDGVPDSIDDARAFLDFVVGNRGAGDLREAFLASGAAAIDYLEEVSEVRFAAAQAHPDYLDGPGSAYGGRALVPLEFDARRLGKDFARVRPPRDVFTGLGGMMVGRNELSALLNPFRSLSNLRTTTRLLTRHFLDRLKFPRGTRLLMGNALVARLFYSLRERKVPIWFESGIAGFIRDGERIIGALVDTPQGRKNVRARKGVVLATGGVCWNEELRGELFPMEVGPVSQAPDTNTGDGIALARSDLEAGFDDGHDSPALWMPCSFLENNDGSRSIWPHIILDRAKPGLIAVGPDGRRFVNETASYHDFCMGMIKAGHAEAWLVVDSRFIGKYGLGLVLPGKGRLRKLLRAGYLVSAPTLDRLAKAIDVDRANLVESVERNNRFAQTGVDEDFGRGTSVMNRFNGDAEIKPNPCLGPIDEGPFYALKVKPVDLAGCAGLICDVDGRVLDNTNRVIKGLYACGNDARSIFCGTYPGPGTTIGPAIVFGWRIARHAAEASRTGA
ncbi:MAG: FAD-dependent oxidoreductase [Rhizobiaceae bacterium]